MSKFIIAGFIILCVVALVIVVVLLKKNKAEQHGNKAPHLNPNALRNRQDIAPVPQANRVNEDNSVGSAPQSLPETKSPVMIAQSFIEQQRYDEAEAELKKGIQLQPNDESIQLKLLNLYAITHNSDAFQDAFARIIDSGNVDSIKQAENIKSMLEAEQATQNFSSNVQATETAESEESQDDSLDNGLDFAAFTASNSDDSTHDKSDLSMSLDAEAEGTVDDFDLNFDSETDESSTAGEFSLDSLETSGLDEDPFADTTSFVEDEQDSHGLDDEFSLSLEGDSPSAGNKESSQADVADDGVIDFDLSLSSDDEASTESASVVDDGFAEFDLSMSDDGGFSADSLNADVKASDNDMDLADDLESDLLGDNSLANESLGNDLTDEFSLDAFDTGVDNVEVAKDESLQDTIVPDMDLSLSDSSDAVVASDSVVESVEINDGLESNDLESFEDFSLDIPDVATVKEPSTELVKEEATDAVAPVLDIADDFADFDLGGDLGGDLADVEETETAKVSGNVFDLSDELSFDEPTSTESDSLGELDSVSAEEPVVQPVFDEPTEQVAIATATAFDDLSKEFDIVNEMDNHQVTLDLARHYLDLGEYDSAKRLLNEVVTEGSAEQKQQAKSLLAHAG